MKRVLSLLVLAVWLAAFLVGCANKGREYMIKETRDPMTKGVVSFTEDDLDRLIYP